MIPLWWFNMAIEHHSPPRGRNSAEVFYELGRQRMLDKGRWGPTIFRDLRHDLRHTDKSQ